MSVSPRSPSRTNLYLRRRVSGRPVLAFAFTGIAVVALGVIIYFASTSIAWFASSPTSDPVYARLNQCLLAALPGARSGFAVSADGGQAATFDGQGLAVCRAQDGATPRRLSLPGVTAAAWDFTDTLWIATAAGEAQPPTLWRLRSDDAQPTLAGNVAPVGLAGHARGVVAVERTGRLVSLATDGAALGVAELPRGVPTDVHLAVDASGELVAVVADRGVWMFRTADLSPVFAESPCDVEYLWWRPQPGVALVSCGPDASWALTLNALTGAREAAPERSRERSTLVPKSGGYVRDCEGYPCQASPP